MNCLGGAYGDCNGSLSPVGAPLPGGQTGGDLQLGRGGNLDGGAE